MVSEPRSEMPDDELRRRLGRLTKRSVIDWLVARSRLDEAFRRDLTGLAMPARRPPAPDRWQGSDPLAADCPAAHELRSEALLALGRPHEAFEVLWNAFRRTLRMGFLRGAIAVAPRGRAAHIDAEAMDAAENHPDADLALGFLIARGALDRAAGLIDRRFEELSASARTGLQPVVAALREEDPRQAWQLLRLTLIDALEEGDTEAGALAGGCLRQMRQLAAGGGFAAEHDAFVEQLRQDYRGRAAFWSTVPGE